MLALCLKVAPGCSGSAMQGLTAWACCLTASLRGMAGRELGGEGPRLRWQTKLPRGARQILLNMVAVVCCRLLSGAGAPTL